MFYINWNNNGWTTIQEASKAKHQVEISCYAQDGIVTEIRKRHQDGEEVKLTGAIDANHSLPLSTEELTKLLNKGEIVW